MHFLVKGVFDVDEISKILILSRRWLQLLLLLNHGKKELFSLHFPPVTHLRIKL